MASTAARSRRSVNVWPGYVDALATLLLAVVFLLTVFVVGQFFLSQELTGRDATLVKLNRQIADLTDLLALERSNRRSQEDEVRSLRTTLAGVEAERDQAKSQAEAATVSQGAAGALDKQLEAERGATKRALSQVDLLNEQISAMRRQLAALEDALAASETRDRESQVRIAELGSRLNVALAQKVQELARYRSDFFGRLRQILGNRPDIRVVGDRFVLQSEVLFPGGSATLKPEAGPELDRIAGAIADLARQIPADLPWVLRVDGHTDARPINTSQFPSNWALSAARAIAVVQYLAGKGIPPQHLLAGAFGEFQPLDAGTTEEAYAKNRRIEMKLTER
ncbi:MULTISPECIES: peptidoglycan -binding protein [Methylobacterium]|uniref:Chemotaxis protein MotB n=1 Tax=Methylobacterium brachiatum TaxID=269660 RepID=A0AAJ1TTI2_9HYPH|nr:MULTISPECIES: peptidoglycan -binding protein [Methylobacterium]AYO85482.1 peptidoglycan -binding protein [Methylobacterium brachiatum]EIZ83191.1 OmpA/MotB domain-containing protein [Methylobacterium sp. GXF4]MCB4801915.1 peptidoglycan -binding protein [Methylobacterium brachiatum]MDH2309682.1 peptidoglycan -binding protein [Methylobacterium brachiatum]MDQ0542253.1 chemotaxis protein MotB [Methylobacterium brachiatum]